MAQQGQK